MKAMIRTLKWWSLETGGCYSKVVVSSGLTVYLFIIILHYICFFIVGRRARNARWSLEIIIKKNFFSLKTMKRPKISITKELGASFALSIFHFFISKCRLVEDTDMKYADTVVPCYLTNQ
jgi:hypothetical protein